jgi:type II secretory pathway pseudopilin PulG
MRFDTEVQRSHLLNRLRHEQGGWAVVTAMVVMSIMLIIGLAAIAFVDTESRSSQRERQGEARLNLTEGALSTELYQLSHNWPTQQAFPDCSNGSTDQLCFTPAQLKANYTQVDLGLNPQWNVQVRDDNAPASSTPGVCDPSASGLGGYYDDSILNNSPYDANHNCQLWVRAEGTLDGKHRIVVAKVRVDTRPVQFPLAPFVAGSFNTGNNGGKKVIVDGSGQTGQVRCDSATDTSCVDYNGAQVSNPGSVSIGDSSTSATAIDPAVIDALRKTAQQNGTYYSTGTPGKTQCPTDPSGAVVFVEDLSCGYAQVNVNTTTKQGIFIINKGTLKITGGGDWYGAIYMLNGLNCGPSSTAGCLTDAGHHDVVMDMSGTATVHGGIFVDGSGRLSLGSSGNSGNGNAANLIYDPTVFPPLQAYGTAGIIQNTWREITAG